MTAPPRGVVAVVRTGSTAEALTLARGYVRAGVPGVEVTLTVPDAAAVVRAVAGEADGRVGAGTVLDPARVDEVVASGAAYVVAPDTNPAVVARAAALGVPVVAGTLTPTEMTTAVRLGAAAVKVFPVGGVGGVRFVRAVLEPLPFLRIVASGGITVEEVPAYLEAGAWAVCLGKELVDRAALAAGDVDGVAEHAAGVLARVGIAAAV